MEKADKMPAFSLIRSQENSPRYGNLLHRHAARSFDADEIEARLVFAEIVGKFIAAGIAIINDLAKHIADGDVFEAFGFDFDLTIGRVRINIHSNITIFFQ